MRIQFLGLTLLAGTLSAAAVHAADLSERRAPAPALFVAPAYNWTGFNVGVFGGLGSGNTKVDYNFIDTSGSIFNNSRRASFDNRASGFLGGAQIGYDYQFGQFVLGAVADIAASDYRSKSATFDNLNGPATTNLSVKLDYLGTVRGRLGYAMDRFLVYAHGGLAYGSVKLDGGGAADGSKTRTGYSVGAGVQYALTQNISVFGEYSYIDLGRQNFGVTTAFGNSFTNGFGTAAQVNASRKVDINLIKIGASYRF